MIKIDNIKSGWLDFTINNHTFSVSYLSDFKEEIQELLYLPYDDMTVKRIMLDGEGIDLYLTAWRVFDDLFIVWEQWGNDIQTYIMKFKYDDFIKKWNEEIKKIEDEYNKNFVFDPDKT